METPQEEKAEMEKALAAQKAQNLEGMSQDLEAYNNQDKMSAADMQQDDDDENDEKFE